MHDPELRAARAACAEVELPHSFLLIGPGGENIIGTGTGTGPVPYVVDAEGIVLRGGAVHAWCRAGCCAMPRSWPSIEAVADFHGSFILDGDGTVRAPRNDAGAVPAGVVPGAVVPRGDGPEAG